MNRRRTLLVLTAALAVLLLPATAVAKPGYTIKPKGLHLRVELPASNGYTASIETKGHRQIALRLSKGGVGATYTVLGQVTRRSIRADFGSLGRVALRFRARRTYRPAESLSFLYDRCKGRKSVGERGIFVGGVRFDGERGYARVRAHRAAGRAIRSYRRICKNSFRAGGGASASAVKPGEEDLFLIAQGKGGGLLRSLVTFRSAVLGLTLAIGGERSKLGRVTVQKSGLVIDYPRAIRFSPRGRRPMTAQVKLARPFEGKASYVEEEGAPPIWSGDLGIRVPGGGLVPLTGPEFEIEICRAFTFDEVTRCSNRLLESQPFRYGSGSHSQPLRWPGSPR